VPDGKKQNPIIFPGMELSLTMPCQAIVILDTDSDPTIQFSLLEALNLRSEFDESSELGPTVTPLGITELDVLESRLNENSNLQGRFIILPHVGGEDGHKSLLRRGFNVRYSNMTCVGGYIEKDWGSLRIGDRNILEGGDSNWGSKSLGIFQTTDFRGQPENYQAERTTWLKIAEPTAEALRQACLAKESRIFQEEPKIPTTYIHRIEVSDSVFMGKIEFEFNPQFNALIGGRGTGKSTILEYIRWALQDKPVTSDGFIFENRERIIETLKDKSGIVKIYWKVDGVEHVVKADSKNNTIVLKIEDGEEKEVTADEISDLIPIRAFSQKQLSTVSLRKEQLQRFVKQPIKETISEIENEIRNNKSTLREIYKQVILMRQKIRELSSCKTKMNSTKERIGKLKNTLTKLKPETQKILKEHALRIQEKQALETMASDAKIVKDHLSDIKNSLETLPKKLGVESDSPQYVVLSNMHTEISNIVSIAKSGVETIFDDIKPLIEKLRDWHKQWKEENDKYYVIFTKAQAEVSEHEEKIKQIGKMEEDEAKLKQNALVLQQDIENMKDTNAIFETEIENWIQLHKKRADMLEEECETLMDKSSGYIHVELERGADIDDAIEKLKSNIQGAWLKESNWNQLREQLVSSESTVKSWQEFMKELRLLAENEIDDFPENYIPNQLDTWDITDKQRRGILEKLTPDTWIEIALTSLNDIPKFYYNKGEKKIVFEKASAGQQATALLQILLNEEGGPLIIDQPEDDLDKKFTFEIVQQIWNAKESRQIIVASHDANIVVNGDAELVIHCDYAEEGDISKGTIKHLGSIDVCDIRKAITQVMEGGKKAFELRKEKYGF